MVWLPYIINRMGVHSVLYLSEERNIICIYHRFDFHGEAVRGLITTWGLEH